MHQVLYIVQLLSEECDMHIVKHLVHRDVPCDHNLVFLHFIQSLYSLSKWRL